MTPEQEKLAYELITNPPPGSKLGEAKEWGVDLALLFENIKRTPTERAQSFASHVRTFNDPQEVAKNRKPSL